MIRLLVAATAATVGIGLAAAAPAAAQPHRSDPGPRFLSSEKHQSEQAWAQGAAAMSAFAAAVRHRKETALTRNLRSVGHLTEAKPRHLPQH
jgi:hypothetical protein